MSSPASYYKFYHIRLHLINNPILLFLLRFLFPQDRRHLPPLPPLPLPHLHLLLRHLHLLLRHQQSLNHRSRSPNKTLLQMKLRPSHLISQTRLRMRLLSSREWRSLLSKHLIMSHRRHLPPPRRRPLFHRPPLHLFLQNRSFLLARVEKTATRSRIWMPGSSARRGSIWQQKRRRRLKRRHLRPRR
jgi:hypothetical protein